MFWQIWGKLLLCSVWTSSSVLTPLPFGGESSCHGGGKRPDFPNKSSSLGDACGFSFLSQHPWSSDSSGWEFLFLCFPSLSGDRDQSPMFLLWVSTRLLSNLCLGVTLVGLIFVYGDQLGQISWKSLPQNIDWVLISFSREEGSWGFGLGVPLTRLVTCCSHRQKWHPRSRSGGCWCAVTRMSGQRGELCGLWRVQGRLQPWAGEGKEVLNCLVCCGSLDT